MKGESSVPRWTWIFVVATVLVDTLNAMELRYPEPQPGLAGLIVE